MAVAEETQVQTAELAAAEVAEIVDKADLLELPIREAVAAEAAKVQVQLVLAAEAALESLS